MRHRIPFLTPRGALLGSLLSLVALSNLGNVGCSLPHAPLRPPCHMSVRPTGADGLPVPGTATVTLSFQRGNLPGSTSDLFRACTAPIETDVLRRWNALVVSARAGLCTSTDSATAADRALLCPAGSTGWCKVAGSTFCDTTRLEPGTPCITPPAALALPDCPEPSTPAGSPRLCIRPSPISTDLGTPPVGSTPFPLAFSIRNCGGGRLIVPPPLLTPGLGSMASFAGPDPSTSPGLTGACMSLTGPEATAGGAFLGTEDRADCIYFVRFSPESVGPHSAILRLTSNDSATGMLTLVYRGTGVSP